jgi:hypothetical protein
VLLNGFKREVVENEISRTDGLLFLFITCIVTTNHESLRKV